MAMGPSGPGTDLFYILGSWRIPMRQRQHFDIRLFRRYS